MCNPCNCPNPDFIERNGTWLLGTFGIASALVGGMFAYFLKSMVCIHINTKTHSKHFCFTLSKSL